MTTDFHVFVRLFSHIYEFSHIDSVRKKEETKSELANFFQTKSCSFLISLLTFNFAFQFFFPSQNITKWPKWEISFLVSYCIHSIEKTEFDNISFLVKKSAMFLKIEVTRIRGSDLLFLSH